MLRRMGLRMCTMLTIDTGVFSDSKGLAAARTARCGVVRGRGPGATGALCDAVELEYLPADAGGS